MFKKKFFIPIFVIEIFIFSECFSETRKIKEIEFKGNDNTSIETLKSITQLKSGEEYNKSKIDNAIQNIKNTTVFTNVTAEIIEVKENKNEIKIVFNMEKKWTIIPYLIAGSGGGTSYYSVGVFDTNLFNELYIANFNIKVENNKPNLSLSLLDNYAFDNNVIMGIIANVINKKDIYFDSNNKEIGYISFKGSSINPYFLWKFTDYFDYGGGILYQESSEINDILSTDEVNINQQNNIKTPYSYTTVSLQSRLNLGIINFNELTQSGVQFTSLINSTAGLNLTNSNKEDYNETTAIILGFYPISFLKSTYIATRLGFYGTDSNNPIKLTFLGGLDKVRGFNYSQFNGKTAYYLNFEFRYTAWEGNIFAFQVVPFFDMANTGNDVNQIISKQSASSYGMGIRIPFKNINKIAVRIDYAQTITPFKLNGLSFGLTQLF
jgi:outer membrane protein assembly factor BamA